MSISHLEGEILPKVFTFIKKNVKVYIGYVYTISPGGITYMKKNAPFRKLITAAASAAVAACAVFQPMCFCTVSAANIIAEPESGSQSTLPWHLLESGNTASSLTRNGDSLEIRIRNTGSDDKGALLCCRGISLKKGCRYCVSYDISSDSAGRYDTAIGLADGTVFWQNEQDNGSGSKKSIQLGPDEERSFKCYFTAERDTDTAQWYFRLGGRDALLDEDRFGNDAVITISSMKIENADDDKQAYTAPAQEERGSILMNQIGFPADGRKQAVLISDSEEPISFSVIKNTAEEDTVFSGESIVRGIDTDSGDNVHILDFSGLRDEGDFIIRTDDGSYSSIFSIGTRSEYNSMLRDAADLFPLMVSGEFNLRGAGGWIDEGYGSKEFSNSSLAVWSLQNQCEFARQYGFDACLFDGELTGFKAPNGTPDILEAARMELEWMMSMELTDTDYEGLVLSRLEAQETDAPWEVTSYTYTEKEPSLSATFRLSACAAQASRLWQDYDPDFAELCLQVAERTYDTAKSYYDDGGFSSETAEDVSDEYYWATTELIASTGSAGKYYSNISGLDEIMTVNLTDKDDVAWMGSLSLLNKNESIDNLPSRAMNMLKRNLRSTADELLECEEAQGYGQPFGNGADIGESPQIYPHGADRYILNNSVILAYAYEYLNEDKYLDGAMNGMDYVLGRNPMGISYVTGYGKNAVKNPYCRLWTSQLDSTAQSAPAGVLVGGANSFADDSWMKAAAISADDGVLKCYYDSFEASSVNEASVMNNAALVWMSGFAAGIYGEAPAAPEEPDTQPDTSESASEPTDLDEAVTEDTSAETETDASDDNTSSSEGTDDKKSAHKDEEDEDVTRLAVISGAVVVGLCALELVVYKAVKSAKKK